MTGAGIALGVAGMSAKSYGRVLGSNDRVNFAVVGEGEITFFHLVESLSKGSNNLREIDGLVFKENGNNKIV